MAVPRPPYPRGVKGGLVVGKGMYQILGNTR